MVKISVVLMCGLLATFVLSSYEIKADFKSVIFPAAFAQTPDLGFGNANDLSSVQDPSSVDAGGPGDTSNTDTGGPGDISNSTDQSPDAGDIGTSDLNDTLSQDTNSPDIASQIENPDANYTNMTEETSPATSQTVPEFGFISAMVLGASIVAAILIGQRAFFKFDR